MTAGGIGACKEVEAVEKVRACVVLRQCIGRSA